MTQEVSDDEFVHRRIHRASPELLFECLTTPEHLTHFWGPVGTVTPLDGITVELRPGGIFETAIVSESGHQHVMGRCTRRSTRHGDSSGERRRPEW